MVFRPRPPQRRPRPSPRSPIPKPGRRPGPGVGPKGPLKPKRPKGIPESLRKLYEDKRRPFKKLPGGKGILRKKR